MMVDYEQVKEDYARKDREIELLKNALKVTANELKTFIDKANAKLKSNISSSDLDEPEYFDYQTVHDAATLAK